MPPSSAAPATTTSTGLALRVVMLDVDFDVHEPPELLEHLRVLARRLERAAGAVGSTGGPGP